MKWKELFCFIQQPKPIALEETSLGRLARSNSPKFQNQDVEKAIKNDAFMKLLMPVIAANTVPMAASPLLYGKVCIQHH